MDILASGVSTSSTALRCLLGVGFYTRVWGDFLLLAALVLLSILMTFLKNMALNLRLGQEFREEIAGCVILSVYLKYPSITANMLSVLNCHGPVEGSYYLVADFGVRCYDTLHIVNMVLAGLILVVIGVGLPLSMVYAFVKNEHAHEHGQLYFLVAAYKYSCRWWEALVMLRKLFLKIVAIFVVNPILKGPPWGFSFSQRPLGSSSSSDRMRSLG
jgi:hypothetical protein